MKEHRWTGDFRVPLKVIQNEDKDFFLSTHSDVPTTMWPAVQIFCYDCEKQLQEVFGLPCEGFHGTGKQDETANDNLWRNIP